MVMMSPTTAEIQAKAEIHRRPYINGSPIHRGRRSIDGGDRISLRIGRLLGVDGSG
jgi:hypothetical protein